jgi:preprotein translocase subunit SecF
MLKGLSVTLIIISSVFFFSCKKNYTCDCTWTDGGRNLSATYEIKATKKKAKEECNAEQEKYIRNSNKEKIYWRCMLNK